MTSPIAGNEGFIAISNISAPVNNISVGGAASVQEVDISGAFNSAFDGVGLGVVKEVIGYAPTSFSTLATGAANGVWLNTRKGLAAATSTSDANLLKLPNGARVISAQATNNGTAITSTVTSPAYSSLTIAHGSGPGNTPIVAGDSVIMSNTATGSATLGIGINALFGAFVGGTSIGLGEDGGDGVAPNPVGGQGTGYDTALAATNTTGYVSVVNNTGVVGDYSVGTIRDTSIQLGAPGGATIISITQNTDTSTNFTANVYVVTVGENNTYSGSGTGMTFALLTQNGAGSNDIVSARPLTRGQGYRVGETITFTQANLQAIIPGVTTAQDVILTLEAANFEDGVGTGVVVQPLGPLVVGATATGEADITAGTDANGTDATLTTPVTATGLSASSTSGFGSGGVFSIATTGATPANATLTITTAGTGYQLGDKITFVPGTYGGLTISTADLVFTLTATEVDNATFTSSYVGLPIVTRGQTRTIATVESAPTGAVALTTDIAFNPSPENSTYNIRGGSDSSTGGTALTAGDLAMKIKYLL